MEIISIISDSNMYCTTTDLDDIEPEKDNRTTVDVNLVNDDITAVKVCNETKTKSR